MKTKGSLMSDLNWAKVEVRGKQDKIDSLTKKVEDLESKVSAKNKELYSALDTVIDVLGLRDSYPDVEQPYTYTTTGHFVGIYSSYYVPGEKIETTQKIYGREKFLKDIKEAQGAIKSGKALKRIRKALKEAK